jgi:hypothetical protein
MWPRALTVPLDAVEKKMNPMKIWIKTILTSLGYELRRTGAPGVQGKSFPLGPFDAQRQILSSLNQTNITIFDVGANTGQTARRYRAMFPEAEVYCFEPFPNSIAKLKKQLTDDKKTHIVPTAIGREKGVSTFYVNEFDPTNSLLPRPISERRYYPKFAGPKERIELDFGHFPAAQRARFWCRASCFPGRQHSGSARMV